MYSRRDTLLQAFYQNKLIHVDALDTELLKRASESKQIFCPDCQQPILFKECLQKQNHFAHYSLDCSSPFSEPESIEHETGKKAIYHWLIGQFGEEDCFIERKIHETNQRSDTFVSSIRSAFEYQCSPISASTWRKRHDLYKEAAVMDRWILGYSMHSFVQENPHLHKLNPLENEMIQHHGRIIYYDTLTKHFIFLLPEEQKKNILIGTEYVLKPEEVFIKGHQIKTKYDYFFNTQAKRKKYVVLEAKKAKETDNWIKEIKNQTTNSERVLATSKQIGYIKFLLYETNQKIPYKMHGLLKKEAAALITELEKKRKKRSEV